VAATSYKASDRRYKEEAQDMFWQTPLGFRGHRRWRRRPSPSIAADPRHATRWRRRRRFSRAYVCSTALAAVFGWPSVRAVTAETATAGRIARPLHVVPTCATRAGATDANPWGAAAARTGRSSTGSAERRSLRITVPQLCPGQEKCLLHPRTRRSVLNENRCAVSSDTTNQSTSAVSVVSAALVFSVSTSLAGDVPCRRCER
jgi:hypothetical protein